MFGRARERAEEISPAPNLRHTPMEEVAYCTTTLLSCLALCKMVLSCIELVEVQKQREKLQLDNMERLRKTFDGDEHVPPSPEVKAAERRDRGE